MADFNNFGASDEENAEINKLTVEVVRYPIEPWLSCFTLLTWSNQAGDSDNFEAWEKLIRACEAQDGGLNRNSSPQALATLRDVYDRFLLKFPLLFGYWKKYADLEFNISGPESAEMVRFFLHLPPNFCLESHAHARWKQIYERGCASITNCVDLWASYCAFKMETTHTPHLVRE
jgi:pre-mRNA-processing factor 39